MREHENALQAQLFCTAISGRGFGTACRSGHGRTATPANRSISEENIHFVRHMHTYASPLVRLGL